MRAWRAAVASVLGLVPLLRAVPIAAQAPAPPVSKEPEAPKRADAKPPEDLVPYWERGDPRWFVSSAIDVGFEYFRPRISTGYGLPHRLWAGVDANPIVASSAVGGYSGLRLASPLADLRSGARYYRAFRRSYLLPQESYTKREIDFRGDDAAQYVALETELTLTLPVGPGAILGEYAVTYITGVNTGRWVFLETVRVVTPPGWVYRGRMGYGLAFGPTGAIQVAVVGELVVAAERPANTWRGGLLLRWKLFDDLEARANLIPVIASPDSLGIAGGDFGQLGFRWKWASGMP